jgi:RP/EB family microtubule-associated protein
MQDNLEFLQWAKRHWDQYYPGGDYDAVARRKASGAPASSSRAGATSAGGRRGGTTPTTSNSARPRIGGGGIGGSAAALTQELNAQREAIAGLEKERDFYFAKLRDIELLLQQAVEENPDLEKDDDSLVKHIQAILYSTEVCSFLPLFISIKKTRTTQTNRRPCQTPGHLRLKLRLTFDSAGGLRNSSRSRRCRR